MSADIETLRASMRAAQVYGKGQYFAPGRYLLKVSKLFYKRSNVDNVIKENIICEFTVLESSNPDVEVGCTRSSVFAFHHAGWLPRFKALMLALMGVDPDGKIPKEADEAAAEMYVGLRSEEYRRDTLKLPENFMADKIVRAEAMPGKSRKGGDVTNMKWTPVGDAVAA